MRILYVEDNLTNVSLVKRVARHHDVISYIDGQEALDHFEQDKPDLVLMDVQLAGKITGLEVVRELRSRGYKIPIIAVTAYAMLGDRETCLKAGCDDYIAKPLPIPLLVDMIQRYDNLSKERAPQPKQKAASKANKVVEKSKATGAAALADAQKTQPIVSDMAKVKVEKAGDSDPKEVVSKSGAKDEKPEKVEKPVEKKTAAKETPSKAKDASEAKASKASEETKTVTGEKKQTASSNSNMHSS